MKTTHIVFAALSVVVYSMIIAPAAVADNGVGVCVSPVSGAEVTDLFGDPVPAGTVPPEVAGLVPFVGVVVDGGSLSSPGPVVDTSGATPEVHPENAPTYSGPQGYTNVYTSEYNYQTSCCGALGDGETLCFAPV